MYSSAAGNADFTLPDQDLLFDNRDAMPLNLTPINRCILGLSSMDDWLLLILSHNPHRLSRNDKDGISSAIAQALRRDNARLEQRHWAGRDRNPNLQISHEDNTADFEHVDQASSKEPLTDDNTPSRTSGQSSMIQYHTRIQAEEQAYSDEILLTRPLRFTERCQDISSPATALIVYDPAPVLKLTNLDIVRSSTLQESHQTTERLIAFFAATLVMLAQCQLSLLEVLEKLERDTPIPSIESYESRDFATSKMSSRPDRPRSLSGSTIADIQPHEETLSYSVISTVYDSGSGNKEVKWAEKRESEEKDVGTSSKRPKLKEFKQVSSGRVATLMDRFEKFHL